MTAHRLMTTHRLDFSPGNGTRYRLFVVLSDTGDIECIAWPDTRWSAGNLGKGVSADWLFYSGGIKSKADAEAIAAAVMELVSPPAGTR